MNIIKTTTYESLRLKNEQKNQVSTPEKIQKALQNDNCIGFYACNESNIIGFALLRRYADKQFFLWNFLIDSQYQGLGNGREFLHLLVGLLIDEYEAEVITTTYIYGNETARRLYESFGFTQTDVVCEDGVHEVNMEYLCRR